MSTLRRLFVIAFWAASFFAYVAALLPAPEAPHVGNWDKLDHVIAFFTLTFLARAAYPQVSIIKIFCFMAGFGGLIELSQAVPFIHRDAEWADWIADCIAIVVGLIVAWPFAAIIQKGRAKASVSAHAESDASA